MGTASLTLVEFDINILFYVIAYLSLKNYLTFNQFITIFFQLVFIQLFLIFSIICFRILLNIFHITLFGHSII